MATSGLYTVLPAARVKSTTGWTEPATLNQRKLIQTELRRLGRYRGPGGKANTLGKIDGIWGGETIKGLQRSIAALGGSWSGVDIDAIVGMDTLNGMSNYSRVGSTGMGPGGREWTYWGGVYTRLRGVR